jgi:hypothetical protein
MERMSKKYSLLQFKGMLACYSRSSSRHFDLIEFPDMSCYWTICWLWRIAIARYESIIIPSFMQCRLMFRITQICCKPSKKLKKWLISWMKKKENSTNNMLQKRFILNWERNLVAPALCLNLKVASFHFSPCFISLNDVEIIYPLPIINRGVIKSCKEKFRYFLLVMLLRF